MEIRLGTIEKCEKENRIAFADQISELDFENFNNAISELNSLNNHRRLLEIVIANHLEFINAIKNNSKELAQLSLSLHGSSKKAANQFYQNFNRLFINYLSSKRMLLDHFESYTKRRYGHDSNEVKQFKQITAHYYDNYFSYRLLYKLRNYAQHCELPLQDFQLTGKANRQENSKEIESIDVELKIELNPKDLLEKYTEWGPKVTSDLNSLTGKINVFPLIHEVTESLLTISMRIEMISKESTLKAITYIKAKTDHLKKTGHEVCIFTNIQGDGKKNPLKFEIIHIPFEVIDSTELVPA